MLFQIATRRVIDEIDRFPVSCRGMGIWSGGETPEPRHDPWDCQSGLPISWGGLGGSMGRQSYGSPMECMGLANTVVRRCFREPENVRVSESAWAFGQRFSFLANGFHQWRSVPTNWPH